jgi:hypothetical protein
MSIPVLGWIKIHPQPDSYPVLAGFFCDILTDNAIIKSRKSYIVGHFLTIPSGLDFYPAQYGYVSAEVQMLMSRLITTASLLEFLSWTG